MGRAGESPADRHGHCGVDSRAPGLVGFHPSGPLMVARLKMIDSVCNLLRCPVTGSDLTPLDGAALDRAREAIRAGGLRHAGGAAVSPALAEMEAALATPDGALLYPVVEGIFVLLPGLALVPTSDAAAPGGVALAEETDAAMRFYDEVGWRRSGAGDFEDAVKFEDLRPVTREYARLCHRRVARHLPPRGKYLLDVASGPVQYDEYLEYSEGFEKRICGDVSFAALRAARRKLGDRALYFQCDITRLPIRSGAVDAFVSLHTIYHVPAELQLAAFRELERVCAGGGCGAVVYSWGEHSIPMRLLAARWRPLRALKRLARKLVPTPLVRMLKGDPASPEPGGGLYFHAHDIRWFRENVNAGGGWRIAVWRSVSVPFTKRWIHPRLLGGAALRLLYAVEERWPASVGGIGQYPMLLFRKENGPGPR